MTILSNVDKLSKFSHQIIDVECDFKYDIRCRKVWKSRYKDIHKTLERNQNKIICLYCSRSMKFSGRKNPNIKYNINDNFFKNIDSKEKAYLLGWIASDGHISKNGFSIEINNKDIECLEILKNIINPNLNIKQRKNTLISLTISSKEISNDLTRLLKLVLINNSRKKSNVVQFPEINDNLKIDFIRGYFDGDGCVSNCRKEKNYPRASFSSLSKDILLAIQNYIDIPGKIYNNQLEYTNNNALDFLGKIYSNTNLFLKRKYELYLEWCNYVPALRQPGYKYNYFNITKTQKNAIIPSKIRISDSGYDLTILDIKKDYGHCKLYGTGIKIRPDFGYFCVILPKSSLIKTDYILTNSIGIIDRSYTGELLVALSKIDNSKPDLELPGKYVQFVPIPIQHFEIQEVDELEETERGIRGFGSSN